MRERAVSPENLLVTTFTNEAAEELYDRLYPFLGQAAHDIHISTIHSFCQTLLDRYPAAHPWGPPLRPRPLEVPQGAAGRLPSDVVATFNLCAEERVEPAALVADVKANGARLLGLKKANRRLDKK